MKFRHAKQYTENEIITLRRMFAEYYSYKDIGTALNRTSASIVQRLTKLKLKRDHKLVRLVERHGLEVLAVADDPVALAALKLTQRGEDTQRKRSAREIGKRTILVKMKVDMAAGVDYTRAMKIAHDAGCSVRQIAQSLGVTLWHVQSKVAPPARVKATLPCWP